MISTDFAPNESIDDALVSALLLFKPWQWKRGEATLKIKKQISRLFANKNVFLFLTGRAALYHLLNCLNLPPHIEVAIQAFTCEAVTIPIIANNLAPVYIDIETDTYSMDINDLEKKLSPKTQVIILQHTFGFIPAQRNAVLSIATKRKLLIIEDLAHGFDASLFKNDKFKTIKLLSFGRSKALSSVFGAAVVTDNDLIVRRLTNRQNTLSYPDYVFILRLLLYKPLAMIIKSTYEAGLGKLIHKLINKLNILVPEITLKEKRGEFDNLFDKAYPNALAVLLLNQLRKFNQLHETRKRVVNYYKNHLKNVPRSTFHVLCPLIRFPLIVSNRDEILDKAKKQNIFLGKWYDQVVAPKDLDLKKVGYRVGSCPTAEKICQKIINLPTNISENKAKIVIKFINQLL